MAKLSNEKNYDPEIARLLAALSRHVGVEHAVSMAELSEIVFQRQVGDRINDTRELRLLITKLRMDGIPIASISSKNAGGYYLCSAGSELTDYLDALKKRGISALAQAAKIQKTSLDELLGQVRMNLQGAAGN